MKTLSPSSAGWEAYTQSKSPELREQLLLQYLPLVRRVASRMLGALPRSVRLDDLVSSGVVGLLASLEHFDPTLGVKFETFAMNRIRGAMVDSLRELDWVPRSIRQKARHLERTLDGLAQQLGRIPEDTEIATGMNVSVPEYHKLLDEINVAVLLSLDDTLHGSRGDQSTLGEVASDPNAATSQDRLEEHELRGHLISCLKSLPEQERLVVALYYYEELTFREIGEVLSLTESRVSQIHSKAILKLRTAVRTKLSG